MLNIYESLTLVRFIQMRKEVENGKNEDGLYAKW